MSCSYDKESGTGGSNGATMRYKEGDYGANAGLKVARDLLEPIKAKYPWISYADLWTLAGVTAIEEMGGERLQLPLLVVSWGVAATTHSRLSGSSACVYMLGSHRSFVGGTAQLLQVLSFFGELHSLLTVVS